MTSVLCEIVTMTYENGLSLVNVHTVKTRTEFPKHPHPHRLQPTIRGLPSVQRESDDRVGEVLPFEFWRSRTI